MTLTDWLSTATVSAVLLLLVVAGLTAMLSGDKDRRDAALKVFTMIFGVVTVVVEFLRKVFGKL